MSVSRQMLFDLADGLFAKLADLEFAAVWRRVEEAGFASLLIAEANGGFGGDWDDAYEVLRLAGRHALPAPLAETIIANRLLTDAGIAPPSGPISLAGSNGTVGYGRQCDFVVFVGEGEVGLFETADCRVREEESIAGEPCDVFSPVGPPMASALCVVDLMTPGAFARVAQSAGALEATFELTLEHVNTRVQFGRPLDRFQAVQQTIAELSVETAAVDAAGQAMAWALDQGRALGADDAFEIAAAKL